MQTISDWLTQAAKQIPRLDAEIIVARVLKLDDRAFIFAHGEQELSDEQLAECDAILRRRAQGEALAIIFDSKEFYGRDFWIDGGKVLIPRPESEDIITLAKEIKPKTILDIGTGSGCLAITLALELPHAKVSACDISDDALRIATKNSESHKCKIKFYKSDLLQEVGELPELIVANLPYVDANWGWLDKNALSYEPATALYAEQGGLALIFKLIEQIEKKKHGAGHVLLEADPCQHQDIIEFAQKHQLSLEKKLNYIIQFSY